MTLNEEQLAAVQHPLGEPACLIAGAGSGKTRVLTERVRWLIAQGVSPRRICCVTFTNKAGGELLERLELDPSAIDVPKVATIHSLALSAIRKSPQGFGLQDRVTPLDDYDQSQMIRKIVERTVDVKEKKISLGSYVYGLLEKIGYHRSRGLGFSVEYTDDIHEKALIEHSGYHALEPMDLQIWGLYEEEKQCHPPGELIEIVVEAPRNPRQGERYFVPAKVESRTIESLKDGDLAVSWRKKDARTIYSGRPIKVANRNYKGDITTVSSGGKSTRVTHNHWFWVRFNESIKGKYLVYLMYRPDRGFRVGLTKFKKKADSGLSSRMNGEGATKSWILRVCDSRFEAQTWEQVYSFKYGIPQTVFHPHITTQKGYSDLIDLVFSSALPEGARKCLADHNLMEEFPFLQKGDEFKYSQTCGRFFKVAACNLLAGYMSLPAVTRPDWNKGAQHTWRVPQGIPIDGLTKERYEGPVYSLDVDVDHTYIANGLIVGNCNSVVDFDDMIHLFVRRGESDTKWRESLQRQFDVILQDESQDTSPIQWRLINLLLAPDNYNLTCVGDLGQSIYSFQGARPALLKAFSEEWKGRPTKLYRIAKNHRSLPRIIFLANKIQACMQETVPLKMQTFRGDAVNKGKIELTRANTPGDIAMIIAGEIYKDNQKGRVRYKDNAILVRSARQVMDIENALVRHRIPYVVRGGRGLLQTEEVRDIMAYLRLVTNPKDFTALVRAVGVPKRGVGDIALEKIRRVANEKYKGDLIQGSTSVEKLGLFVHALQSIQAFRDYPVQCLDKIMLFVDYKNYLGAKYKKEPDKVKSKLENIDRFKELVRGLSEDQKLSTEDLVFQLTLERAREEDKEGQVTISTIHSSKGLEYYRVYVTNIVEGSIPHRFSMGNDAELEEEKRLLYVACTRAQDELTLCVNAVETSGEDTRRVAPSRFLIEIGIIEGEK